MSSPTRTSLTLLSAAVAPGAGAAFDVSRHRYFAAIASSPDSTSGATINIEGRDSLGNWYVIATFAPSSTASRLSAFVGVHDAIRANVASYADGTHTITLLVGNVA